MAFRSTCKLFRIRRLDGTMIESPVLPEAYERTARGEIIEHAVTEHPKEGGIQRRSPWRRSSQPRRGMKPKLKKKSKKQRGARCSRKAN